MRRRPYDPDSPEDWRSLRALVTQVEALPVPAARWVRAPDRPPTWAALLAGSFNPPTLAHLAMIEAASAAGPDLVGFVVAVRSVDKEMVEAAILEDRLALLDAISARLGTALALTNAGLYVDQAQAFRALLPRSRLSFVIGFDKLVQVFDPRYYDDRDSALVGLLTLADLLVLPRDADGPNEIRALLAEPENRPWATRVAILPTPASLDPTLSASAIRAGDHDLEANVPPESIAFLRRWQPYQPGRYDERVRRLRAGD
ncbi:MAG: hypothetical protein U0556_10490 [Dehalococcoidia bacterium]